MAKTAVAPDFWLPERLARLSVVIDAERDTYASYLKLARRWLAAVQGPTLQRSGINPAGIHTADALWRDGVEDFTQDAILPILGLPYSEYLSGDFDFTHRPYVARHLAEVRNRLVHVPDEVFDDVRAAVLAGTAAGSSIPELARQIRLELLNAGAPVWTNRATVVARTETIGAYNAGTNDAFHAVEEVLDVQMEKVWLATEDDRTRPTHRHADGQRVPLGDKFSVGGFDLDFPGDPTGPPQEVIQCRCTMLLVEPGEELDTSDRQLLASAGIHVPYNLGTALLAGGFPLEWAILDGFDHSPCTIQFCRNPLHPGPCKGWKHTLNKVAPGVYNALEQARVDKLNEKRKAKIKALQDAGKPVPKSLLKPITVSPPKGNPPGNLAEQGTQAPLSPATEAKLVKVAKKTQDAFDPKVIAAKKAEEEKKQAEAKAKAQKLAAMAEAAKKLEQAKKAEAQAKAAKEAEAAKAKAEQPQVGIPPKQDSDAKGALVMTPDQQAAVDAVGSDLPATERLELYRELTPDDMAELTPDQQAGILADLGNMANGFEPGLPALERNLALAHYKALTGGKKPPEAPAPAPTPTPPAAPAPPAKPADTGKPDPDVALAKANAIVNNAGNVDPYDHLTDDVTALSPAEFKTLPPAVKAAVLADLQEIANDPDVPDSTRTLASKIHKAYTGQEAPTGTPPTPEPPKPDVPNTTPVPATPTAPAGHTPAAAKAAGIAANPKGTPLKDRIAAYGALSQDDVDSMSLEELGAVQKDLAAIKAWYQKKNLKSGAAQIGKVESDLQAKINAQGPPPVSTAPAAPDLDTADAQLTPGAAPDLGVPKPDPPKPPPAPVYNKYQQQAINATQQVGAVPDGEIYGKVAALDADEFNALSPTDKASVLATLEHLGKPSTSHLGEAQIAVVHDLYKKWTGAPHPHGAGPASAPPAPTPEPAPVLPKPKTNTFDTWQNAKKSVVAKTSYKGTNKALADAVKTGTAQQRLDAYSAHLGSQAAFNKLPVELQEAIVADLDNMATAPGDFFTASQRTMAKGLRQALTGKGPGESFAPAPAPVKFTSQAAEKAHHIAANPGLHPVSERLAAYKKLSATGFASLPPETQKKIAADLAALDTGSDVGAGSDVTYGQMGEAAAIHKKLTGAEPGDSDFVPIAPKKTATSLKGKNPAQAKAIGHADNPPAAADHGKVLADYDAMSTEEFEALPATVQKKIINQINNMGYGASTADSQVKSAVLQKFTGSPNAIWNWKPKTAAQKKAAAMGKMTPAQHAQIASDYSEATADQTFEQKVKGAVSGSAVQARVPHSLTHTGSRSVNNIPTTNGYTATQMRAAIQSYKGSGYLGINGLLRNLKGAQVQPHGYGETILAMDAAFENSRLSEPVQVWRGVRAGPIFGDLLNGDLTGVEFTEHGYGSTTYDRDTAVNFSGSVHSGQAMVMRVLMPPGVGAIQVSGAEYESEILLQRGLRWRVVADRGISGGRRQIDVEIIYP